MAKKEVQGAQVVMAIKYHSTPTAVPPKANFCEGQMTSTDSFL